MARLFPLMLFAGLVFAAQPASAQYYYWTAYSPLVTYRPCCNNTVSYTASYSYPVRRVAAYAAPTPACCSTGCCATGCQSCGSAGCSNCCGTSANTVTAGTASAVNSSQAKTSNLTRACKTCTVGDAKVFSGKRGMMYIDGERGYFQMTWGNQLTTGDLAYRRQDDKFNYYEALMGPADATKVPREWAVARQGCAECRYSVWTNYNEAGEKQWTKAHSAELQCVTPFAPPAEQTRMKPAGDYDDGRKESNGNSDARTRTDWKTVPARTSDTKSVTRPLPERLRFHSLSAKPINTDWTTDRHTRTARLAQ